MADVQRVAAKYFTEKNRTVATLIPEKEAAQAANPAAKPAAKTNSQKTGAKKKK
ncbi:MAG: hypothetical protein U0Y68_14330 [Blastocatellia bacterium]